MIPSSASVREVMAGFQSWQEVAGTVVRRSRVGLPPSDLADIVVRLEMLACTPQSGFAIHWLPHLIAGLWWQPPTTPTGVDDILWVFATPLVRTRIATADRPMGYGIIVRAEALPVLLGSGVYRVHGMVPAEDVVDWDVTPIRSLLRSCTDDESRVTVLCEFIRQRRSQSEALASSPQARLARLAIGYRSADGHGSVHELEQVLHLGERHLQRLFRQFLGMTPKQFLRLRRFHAALTLLLDDPSQDLISLAMRLGFSDQAHLTREFTRLTGLSPRRLLEYPGAHLSLHFGVLVVDERSTASDRAPAPDHAMEKPSVRRTTRRNEGGLG